ncbi:MAG: ammonium transporter, partial [Microcystaceae cyanobacterium]
MKRQQRHSPRSPLGINLRWPLCLGLALILIFSLTGQSLAQSLSSLNVIQVQQSLQVTLNTVWVTFSGCLGFLILVGLAIMAAGFCRQKNVVNLLTQNLLSFALAILLFWAIGFGLMFGEGTPLFGTNGFFLLGGDNSPNSGSEYQGVFDSLSWAAVPLQAKFFFQVMLAGIPSLIVAGAVAERIQFLAFLLFSCFLVAVIYPIAGHWVWGDGWLAQLGFWDFAGATVVHSVGGWAAFVGAVLLGPRLGKYQGGESFALPGHNLPLATLGCLLVWLGWFGFNGGAAMSSNPFVITHILLVTNLAAATGGIGALLAGWFYFGKPDLSLMLNGILGGLVAISAACRFVDLGWAALIGAIAGVLVVIAVDTFDRLRLDDPVGGLSVHLVCGIWGTLAIALFAIGPENAIKDGFTLYEAGPVQGLFLG